jgi:hypothetical protein
MILALHTGPKSAPQLALFDTTGIAIVACPPSTFMRARPEVGKVDLGKRFPGEGKPYMNRPVPEHFLSAGQYEEVLAEWEASLAVEVAAWEAAKATWKDEHYRRALVGHGPRCTFDGDDHERHLWTPVHESPEEIAELLTAHFATPRAATLPTQLDFWKREAEGFEARLRDVLAALDEAGVDTCGDKLEEGDAVRALTAERDQARRERNKARGVSR